jgi:hypothetical protein
MDTNRVCDNQSLRYAIFSHRCRLTLGKARQAVGPKAAYTTSGTYSSIPVTYQAYGPALYVE